MIFANDMKRAAQTPRKALAKLCHCLLFGLVLAFAAQAHSLGVGVEIAEQTVIVRTRYADGAFPDADVLVYSPGAPGDQPFQSGKTDRGGVFSFVPDAAGSWRVIVDDGMGHYKEVEVAVGGGAPAAPEPFSPPLLRLAAAAVGLAALGFYLGRVSQRQTGRKRSPVEGT